MTILNGKVKHLKCHRLFRPKISKVKTSFAVEIREVSNTLFVLKNNGISRFGLAKS